MMGLTEYTERTEQQSQYRVFQTTISLMRKINCLEDLVTAKIDNEN
jgi:hypothetical protein